MCSAIETLFMNCMRQAQVHCSLIVAHNTHMRTHTCLLVMVLRCISGAVDVCTAVVLPWLEAS